MCYISGSQSGRYRPPGGGEKLQGGRWSRNGRLGGGEAEMGGWGAIGDPVNNYVSVVLLTLSDQMP